MSQNTTLIYPGPFNDNCFLNKHWSRQYATFILIDAMPASNYFPGWTNETFIEHIKDQFGLLREHDIDRKILYFLNGVEYRYDCDAENLETLQSDADIFISGYFPKSWQTKGFLESRKIFRSCCTRDCVPQETIVHGMECNCFDDFMQKPLYQHPDIEKENRELVAKARSKKAAIARTLIYPNPKLDNSFLTEDWTQQYTKFVLVDTLPNVKYFWWCTSEAMFMDSLTHQFGRIISHDKARRVVYLQNRVEYHYNCDLSNTQELEPGADIYLGHSIPNKWQTQGLFTDRTIFLACSISDIGCDEVVVHSHDCCCFDDMDNEEEE